MKLGINCKQISQLVIYGIFVLFVAGCSNGGGGGDDSTPGNNSEEITPNAINPYLPTADSINLYYNYSSIPTHFDGQKIVGYPLDRQFYQAIILSDSVIIVYNKIVFSEFLQIQ